MLFKPQSPLMLFDAPADNGGGGTSGSQPAGEPQNSGSAEIADFDAWLNEQPEPVRKAYEAHTGKLHNALKSERETRKSLEDAQKAAAKAQQDAETEEARKRGEFQKLYEQQLEELKKLQARVAELEPMQESAKKYQQALAAQLETAKKAVPAHLLPLLEKLPVDEQLQYIAANADKFKSSAGGPPASPAPADPSEAQKAKIEQLRKQYAEEVRRRL